MPKNFGYGVETKGRARQIVKLYDNHEDAETHYNWQVDNPFAMEVRLFEFSWKETQTVKTHKETEDSSVDDRNEFLKDMFEGDADEPGRRESEGPDNSADGASETDAD